MKQYHILIAFSLLATIGLTSCGDRPQNAPNNIATDKYNRNSTAYLWGVSEL